MKIDLISILVIIIALLLNGFLIASVYYAKHKSETKFGKISRELDNVISKDITEIKGMFIKKDK